MLLHMSNDTCDTKLLVMSTTAKPILCMYKHCYLLGVMLAQLVKPSVCQPDVRGTSLISDILWIGIYWRCKYLAHFSHLDP